MQKVPQGLNPWDRKAPEIQGYLEEEFLLPHNQSIFSFFALITWLEGRGDGNLPSICPTSKVQR
jgi:hypothetical protein